jgi:hypothetical protein
MGNEVSGSNVVICYSGHCYAQRPLAFFAEGQRLEVSGVETEWASPSQRGFKVRTGDGRRFKLIYNESGDQWQVFPA